MFTWGRRPRRNTNGKHKVNTGGEGKRRPGQPAGCPSAHPWGLAPWATSTLPGLTSGYITGAKEEGGGEEREAIEGDGRERLS